MTNLQLWLHFCKMSKLCVSSCPWKINSGRNIWSQNYAVLYSYYASNLFSSLRWFQKKIFGPGFLFWTADAVFWGSSGRVDWCVSIPKVRGFSLKNRRVTGGSLVVGRFCSGRAVELVFAAGWPQSFALDEPARIFDGGRSPAELVTRVVGKCYFGNNW